ncbi:MAG: DPP IV N-terminal domain-containing protein, partial [Planctomycetota bacterium]
MYRMHAPLAGLAFVALSAGWLHAGDEARRWQGTAADYQRAGEIQQLTRNKVFKARVVPHWFAKNSRFWYRNDLAEGRREFVVVDAAAGRREPAFDHERLAAALAKATGKPVQAERLPIESLDFPDTGQAVVLRAQGKTWECSLPAYELRPLTPTLSPEGRGKGEGLPAEDNLHPTQLNGPETSLSFVNRTAKDVKLFWLDWAGERQPYGVVRPGQTHEQHTFAGHVWLVTDSDGKPQGVYQAVEDHATVIVDGAKPITKKELAQAAAQPGNAGAAKPAKWVAIIEEHNVWLRETAANVRVPLTQDGSADDAYQGEMHWSPDGQYLVVLKTKPAEEHKVYEVESSPKDQVQPKLRSFSYLKPGDRIAVSKPHLFDAAARKEIPLSDALFPNPWSIEDVRWEPDARRFTFLYNQRGHQVLRIIAVDARTGQAQAIVDEQSKTFIDYAGKRFVAYLDAAREIVWMSERDGWNHLYLYDAQAGKVKNQITRGEWAVRGVDRVDEQKRQIWFHAGGIDPRQDPYHVHYCRINLDGSGLVRLTEGDGTHTVQYSPDRNFLLDTYSRVDLPPVTELRRTEDGGLLCTLERADASLLLATGWQMPERFSAKGRDGTTDIYGIILRPLRFDPARRCPVIENIYAGPHGSFVPKAWAEHYGMEELAELGFVLVMIDGMGTSHRSKAFQDVCWKNLADAGLPDRILWLKAAAQTRPYLDLARVASTEARPAGRALWARCCGILNST